MTEVNMSQAEIPKIPYSELKKLLVKSTIEAITCLSQEDQDEAREQHRQVQIAAGEAGNMIIC